MDIIGSALSAAQTLTDALQCFELIEKLSVFDYDTELVDLQRTVEAITAVLCDAGTKQELSQQAQVYIQELKDAVFAADDLMDELVTCAQHQRLVDADGSHREKVRRFFSSSNPICVSYFMSRGIKDIKKKLDTVAYNNQFSFKIDPDPIRKRRPETCSYVNEVEITGREDDLESIVGTLLASNNQSNVSFLSIVGIGGLGKTVLAQLVFNDPRVTDAFPLKMWTCVSDQDQKELDVKNILAKILGRNQEGSTMEQVQRQLRAQLAGKKYLLVLDDVWTEKRDQWNELVKYLIGDETGSWIVVTTRSQKTAEITGGLVHQLSGLSQENSWRLFERTAFASDQTNPPDELVMIGQKIVDGCSGVPLAIRVAGSLLYGQHKSKWLSVQKIGLVNIRDGDNGIMPILKLSFNHLESPLKNCFQYCALFPKDYVIEKQLLISLWMAQGYIVPLDNFQSIEEAGEEYFSILLRRCFFQDIKKDELGQICSCKIHDLMHDIAKSVSMKEIYAVDAVSGNVDKNVRHLSVSNISEYERYSFLGKIRSLLCFQGSNDHPPFTVEMLLESFRFLRVLNLCYGNFKCLPNSIGDQLIHLRWLDLSGNVDMEVLPNSITKLYNLQTLRLYGCKKLKELPKDLSRLVKLIELDIRSCNGLTYMPRGIGKLTCLQRLNGFFIIGGEGSCTSWKQWYDELEDLKALNNLKGKLEISMWWPKDTTDVVVKEVFYLRHMEHLDHIGLHFSAKDDSGRVEDGGNTMRLMEGLQPHPNLKSLRVHRYHGVKMPGWVTFLPHLVMLHLEDLKELESLPCLGNLRHLKILHLSGLLRLEYIEEENSTFLARTAEEASFFPSLEKLYLEDLPKLKGWRKGAGVEESSNNSINSPQLQNRICLSHLKNLSMNFTPELECTVLCPALETLDLCIFNERLQIYSTQSEAGIENQGSSGSNLVPKLREVRLDNGAWLNSMLMESIHSLQTLCIEDDAEMVELPNCMQHLSALLSLRVQSCKFLKAMPSWMPKLVSLRHLTVRYCSESLKKRCQKDPPGEDWPFIQHIPNITFDDH